MFTVSLLVLLAGYTLVYYGATSMQGPGVGILDLIIPGHFKGTDKSLGDKSIADQLAQHGNEGQQIV